jgi:hypothetical protein
LATRQPGPDKPGFGVVGHNLPNVPVRFLVSDKI